MSEQKIKIEEEKEIYESYSQLLWRRFKRSKPGIVGFFLVMGLVVMAISPEFFCPTDYSLNNLRSSSMPPSKFHFIDDEGKFHLRPFVYEYNAELVMETMLVTWIEDTSTRYPIRLFRRSWEYSFFGIPARVHLYDASDGPIYIMGTDKQGRDIFGRACYAGRISLSMGLVSVLISMTVGALVGIISGYYGGKIDDIIQRIVEFIMSFPQLPLWMALSAVIPPNVDSLFVFMIMSLIFAFLGWTRVSREVRGKVMAFRETDYVMAAKEMGASDLRIILVHMLPNTLSHLIVVVTMSIPAIILAEAFLSYLGLGIREPLTSWGFMMKNAQNLEVLGTSGWIMSPSIFIITAVLGFNFLGDGLRDAADPYSNS